MKKYIWLFLLCWLTASVWAQTSVSFIGQNFDEYVLTTKDQKCTLRYLSPVKVPADWSIYISDENCLENGAHEVHILDPEQVVRDSLSGYFMDGYFVGSAPLNTPIVKRVSTTPGIQEAFYFIEKDPALKIDYIGKMTARIQNFLYPAFNVCEPFHVIAVTSNKKLFEKEETLSSLVTVVKSYAQNICPNVSTLIFEASDSPQYETNVFSRLHLEKGPTGTWVLIPEKSFNLLVHEKEADLQKQKLLQQTYTLLEDLPPYDRPAFLFGQFKVDFPYQLMTASALLDMPIKGCFVLHVTEKNEATSWADLPFALQIDTPLDPGWYLVTGQITPLSLQEKKKAGISWKKPAAHVALFAHEACRQPSCAEWEETAYLMEKKYDVPRSFFLPTEGTHEK